MSASALILAAVAVGWPFLDWLWDAVEPPVKATYSSLLYWLLERLSLGSKFVLGVLIILGVLSATSLAWVVLAGVVVTAVWFVVQKPVEIEFLPPSGWFYGTVAFVAGVSSLVAALSVVT